MNCEQGDLAVVVSTSGTPEMLGRIVKCIRPAVAGELFGGEQGTMRFINEGGSFTWVVESPSDLPWRAIEDGVVRYFKQRPFSDSRLKPLRDTDGEDEMLRIAGRPKELEKKPA